MTQKIAHERFERLLNVGCGAHFHPSWHNLDLINDDRSVQTHDIRRGLPFSKNYFDAVYHSHLLEHLTPGQGRDLLDECHRVLRPGGVMRIVVPDLERIAKLYLEMLQRAWLGDPCAAANYQWMKLELLDQLVRNRSGGLMGQYMTDTEISNLEFVKSRIGKEYDSCAEANLADRRRQCNSFIGRLKHWIHLGRQRAAMATVQLLLGRESRDAMAEGIFRQQGEVHRWMYDRYSLMQICTDVGFGQFQICMADESMIDGFASYQLDQTAEQIRKPDSLFVECRKAASRIRLAA